MDKRHYSYAHYAKKETAESFESERFGGAIGGYMRRLQEEQLGRWLPSPSGMKILDVGAGSGRTAIPLSLAGAEVVASDASEAMLEVASKNAEKAGASPEFRKCDAMDLPFADREFDMVVCLRVLMHVVDWRKALAEVCRCSGGRLILDFPPRWALAALQVPVRTVASLLRPSVQKFRLFSLRQIQSELLRNGFAIEKVERLWVLPIALHRVFHSPQFTRGLEKCLAVAGLRRLVGAPVTIMARRLDEAGGSAQ